MSNSHIATDSAPLGAKDRLHGTVNKATQLRLAMLGLVFRHRGIEPHEVRALEQLASEVEHELRGVEKELVERSDVGGPELLERERIGQGTQEEEEEEKKGAGWLQTWRSRGKTPPDR